MKKTVLRKTIGGVFLAALFASSAAFARADEHSCSLARSAGNWSFTDNGTVVGVGPRTAVGTLRLDASGGVSNGVATSSLNGSIADETFSGSYTVNPDCSGTINVTIYSGGAELFVINGNTAFDNHMQHLRMIFTSVVEPDGTSLATVINLDANKQ